MLSAVSSVGYDSRLGPEATPCRRKRRALRQSALSSMATIPDLKGSREVVVIQKVNSAWKSKERLLPACRSGPEL
jgi:hypothetical protein